MSRNTVIITGGAGYIGSHTTVQLLQQGSKVVILDNLCNSSDEVFNRIEKITGFRPEFVEGDIRDRECLDKIFTDYTVDSVIHFAGLKVLSESVMQPLKYYQNNVEGSLTLFEVMAAHHCKKIVFSSSAAVYGDSEIVPINEGFPLSATTPYGQSKLMIENILRDLAVSDADWQIALLRYFNPVGAHKSGLIGEDPAGIPDNLMPFVAQVAVGKRDCLSVFGGDYQTPDGTGVRDYIHVEDLAAAHLNALQVLRSGHGCKAYNIGTGKGYSVLDVVNAFSEVSGKDIPYEIVDRRPGDVAECYADPSYSEAKLKWSAKYDLNRMVADHWRWQSNNPNGYEM